MGERRARRSGIDSERSAAAQPWKQIGEKYLEEYE